MEFLAFALTKKEKQQQFHGHLHSIFYTYYYLLETETSKSSEIFVKFIVTNIKLISQNLLTTNGYSMF